MNSLRVFVAVELPAPLRETVAAIQTTLRAAGADVAWVEPQNLHLTLKFLGNVEEARLLALTDALRAAIEPHAPFTMTLEGIGAFPSPRSPRIIWVGVTEGPATLTALAEAVDRAGTALGFPSETRPFAPHLTIGRVRSRRGLAPLVKTLQTLDCPPEGAPVDHVTLFQSTLSPKGPTYTPLAKFSLTR